jgi:putative effector of murein hydrolase
MPTRIFLAGLACVMISAQAMGEVAKAAPQKLNAILCKTEDQAIAVAVALSSGKTEPIAVNDVNKVARAPVCGRYIGYAVVEIEKTENRNGGLYMLAGVRFVEDGALAWTADWVAPFDGTSLSRGT